MSKTRKHHRHKRKHKKHHRTIRHREKNIIKVPSLTPIKIRKISNRINNALKKGSYSPTINKQLVTLKSIDREDLMDCNSVEAFKLKEPLQVGVNGKCY